MPKATFVNYVTTSANVLHAGRGGQNKYIYKTNAEATEKKKDSQSYIFLP